MKFQFAVLGFAFFAFSSAAIAQDMTIAGDPMSQGSNWGTKAQMVVDGKPEGNIRSVTYNGHYDGHYVISMKTDTPSERLLQITDPQEMYNLLSYLSGTSNAENMTVSFESRGKLKVMLKNNETGREVSLSALSKNWAEAHKKAEKMNSNFYAGSTEKKKSEAKACAISMLESGGAGAFSVVETALFRLVGATYYLVGDEGDSSSISSGVKFIHEFSANLDQSTSSHCLATYRQSKAAISDAIAREEKAEDADPISKILRSSSSMAK